MVYVSGQVGDFNEAFGVEVDDCDMVKMANWPAPIKPFTREEILEAARFFGVKGE